MATSTPCIRPIRERFDSRFSDSFLVLTRGTFAAKRAKRGSKYNAGAAPVRASPGAARALGSRGILGNYSPSGTGLARPGPPRWREGECAATGWREGRVGF